MMVNTLPIDESPSRKERNTAIIACEFGNVDGACDW